MSIYGTVWVVVWGYKAVAFGDRAKAESFAERLRDGRTFHYVKVIEAAFGA